MTIRRVLAVVLAGGVLVLVAWVYVLAQQPRFPGGTTVGAVDVKVPPPPARIIPGTGGPTLQFPTQPATPTPGSPYQSFAPPSLPATEPSLLAVKVELRKGLVLEGQIAVTAPLACVAAFGEVGIPLSTIRGIRFHEPQAPAGAPQQVPQATVILTNNDSLTVSLRAAQFQVKTEWGEANIIVSQLKSILLTSDDVRWQEANGRWTLVAVEKPPPAVAEEPGGLAPDRSQFDGASAPIPSVAPAPTIPPPDTRPTEPKLPAIPSRSESPTPTEQPRSLELPSPN
jgi:hypothetical protein